MADQHRRVRAAAITGIGQFLGLLGSTLIGVLVAGTLPPAPRVDAFFGANQIYALALYLGQAVRITAPALMVRSGLKPASLRSGTFWLAGATVAFMVLAAIVGAGLVAPPARTDFTNDLLILAPAAGLHVAAGGLAAKLAVKGSFTYSAAAYAAGSLTSGILLLLVIDGQGASALAPCIAAGAVAVAIVMVFGFVRVEGRAPTFRTIPDSAVAPSDRARAVSVVGPSPDRTSLVSPPSVAFAVRRIGLGSVPALSFQALITVIAVSAGHLVDGGTALISYSFLALFAFTTIAITPMSIVLGPEVAERWNGQTDALVRIIRQATRLSVVVVVPLIVLGFLVGRPLCGVLLSALTDADLDTVFRMLAALTPTLLLAAAATAATVGITAADRLGTLATGLLTVTGASVIAGVLIVEFDASLVTTALIASAFSVAFSLVSLWVAIGSSAAATVVALLTDNVPTLALPILATAALAHLTTDDLALGILLSVPVLLLHAGVVLALQRDTVNLLLGATKKQPA